MDSKQKGKQVITRFGFGEIIEVSDFQSKVRLEKPFLGEEIRSFDNRSEIFDFSDYAVLMVINAPQAVLSTAQYYPTREKVREVLNLPWPPDQSCYLLDFEKLNFDLNFQPGLLINKGFTWQSAWLDRWGRNEIENFSSIEKARSFLNDYRKTMHSTGVGMTLSVLLAMETKKILAYVVLAEIGIILDKGFL